MGRGYLVSKVCAVAMSDSDNTTEKKTPLRLFISAENRPQSLERYIRDGWAVARVLEAWAAMEGKESNQSPLTLRGDEDQDP